MKTISHRELRNNSSAVLREVAAGATFAITHHGEVVATLAPPESTPELPIASRAPGKYEVMDRITVDESTADALGNLRGDR